MRRDPPQPKPQAGGGSFLRGAYSGAWKALGAQTTLRRKPILSDEESGQAAVKSAHRHAQFEASNLIRDVLPPEKAIESNATISMMPEPGKRKPRPQSAPHARTVTVGEAVVLEEPAAAPAALIRPGTAGSLRSARVQRLKPPMLMESPTPSSTRPSTPGAPAPAPSSEAVAAAAAPSVEPIAEEEEPSSSSSPAHAQPAAATEKPERIVWPPHRRIDNIPNARDLLPEYQPFNNSARYMQERVKNNLGKHLSRVMDLFQSMDKNGDGLVSRKEFTNGLIKSGVCAASLRPAIASVFDAWDTDQSGSLDFREFDKKLRRTVPPPGPRETNPAQMIIRRAPPPRPVQIGGWTGTSSGGEGMAMTASRPPPPPPTSTQLAAPAHRAAPPAPSTAAPTTSQQAAAPAHRALPPPSPPPPTDEEINYAIASYSVVQRACDRRTSCDTSPRRKQASAPSDKHSLGREMGCRR